MRNKSEKPVLMDFSGIYHEQRFYEKEGADWVEARGLPGTNCYCDETAAEELRKKIRNFPAKGIHFLDSGNYHYMSRIWLEKVTQPFRLLVFDNHTDMQPPAFGGILSCGGWIAAALEELPLLRQVILCGPDQEAFSHVEEELKNKVSFLSRECMEERMEFIRKIPSDLPLYISVDKDVLCPGDARTTWSQGDLRLEELLEMLQELLKRFHREGQQILGMDICGETDPEETEGNDKNEFANQRLLEVWESAEME